MTLPSPPDRDISRARALARALDSAIGIPGTGIRVGLDPILGLIPGVGDVIGGDVSGYLLLLAARHGAPRSVLLRMASNLAIDSLMGAVPLLGDLFDVGWKANVRNLALLERYLGQPNATRRSSRFFVATVLTLLILVLAGAAYLAVEVVRLLLGALGG